MTDARSDSLCFISGASKPGIPLLDEEAVDLAVVGARPDDRDVGDRAVRDPHLRAVQDPVGAVAPRGRAHRARVGARVGLGQPEAADRVAVVHRRQPALLLLLGAPAPDREHRERALHRDERANARVAGLELEARQPVGDGARARAGRSPRGACRRGRARDLLRELARQDALLEPLADVGHDPLAHEPAHGVADRLLLVVEERVDREEVARIERGRLRGRGHTRMVEHYRAGARRASASASHGVA